jgi:hypothetical protein
LLTKGHALDMNHGVKQAVVTDAAFGTPQGWHITSGEREITAQHNANEIELLAKHIARLP